MPQSKVDIILNDNGVPDYKKSVSEAAIQFGIDPQIALKMLHLESNANPDAVSPKGATGLMQLMPATARQYGLDPSDPAQNIEAGMRHLQYLRGLYKGDMRKTLAAYNAGEGAVQSGRLPLETMKYVNSILGPQTAEMGTSNEPIEGPAMSAQELASNVAGSVKNLPQNTKGFASQLVGAAKNPENWPTMGGIAGSTLMSRFTGGLPIGTAINALIGAAGLGGLTGDIAKQAVNKKEIDPLEMLREAGLQGLWEAGGQTAGQMFKRPGAAIYSAGAGLNSLTKTKDIKQSLQQGLEGGRGSLPVFTASGQRRVADRNLSARDKMYADAQAQGKGGILPSEIARKGSPQILQEAQEGAPHPQAESGSIQDFIRQFIEEHSNVTPAGTVQQQVGPNIVGNNGLPITQGVQTPRIVVENPLTIQEASDLKTGTQTRANRAFRAEQAGQVPAVNARGVEAVARGAQRALEDRIPGLADLNRKIQGDVGLQRGINPTNMSPEQWQQLGISPEIAAQIMSNRQSAPFRNAIGNQLMKAAPAGAALYATHSPYLAAGIYGLTRLLTTPLGERIMGGSLYTMGRPLAGAGRALNATLNIEDPETKKKALLQALGIQ